MSRYFYHGLGVPYFFPSNITTVLKILTTGGIKSKRLLGRKKQFGYNDLDYVSICKKYSKEEYDCAYGSTGFYKYVQDCFCFIISDEIDAMKTETIPKCYWYFVDIVEKMKENPNARYSDMFDEWQVKNQIATSSIIGIGLPMRWLDGVDWKIFLNSLQELKEILSIAEALGLDIVDSSRENFVEEYELEKRKNPHKIYQIQLDCILGSDTSE